MESPCAPGASPLAARLPGRSGSPSCPPAHAASTAQAAGTARAVAARKAAPALSIGTSATSYAFSSMVRLTVSMGRTHGNRAVSVYAAPAGLRQWLWHRGRVSFAGKLRVYFRLTRTTRFTVVCGGDARDAPVRVSRTLNAVARVAEGLSGCYRKARAGAITYYVFHASRMLVLHATWLFLVVVK